MAKDCHLAEKFSVVKSRLIQKTLGLVSPVNHHRLCPITTACDQSPPFVPNHVAAIASGLGSFALQPAFLEEAAAMAFAAILLDLTIYNIFLFSNDNFE